MFIEKLWKPSAAAAFIIVTAMLWTTLGVWALVVGAIAACAAYICTLFAFAIWANICLGKGEHPASIFDIK